VTLTTAFLNVSDEVAGREEMDELHKEKLKKEGKYTAEQFADEFVHMSVENARRYFRKGPEYYPARWKEWGVKAYKEGKRDWVVEISAKPDEPARKLSPAALDTLKKVADLATALEERLPIREVKRRVAQFIEEAPPPNKVLGDILRNLERK
jgi:hypothetical protein